MSFLRRVLPWFLVAAPAAAQTETEPPRVEVEKLAENVYLYTHNAHRSLFVATDGAVLATDPQSPEAAARFVEEIRKVSSAPIRYLVYSHHHDDHVSGGRAFDDDVVIIAHEGVLGHVSGEIVPPTMTFDGDASIYLGSLEVRLVYPGPSETESNIIVHVPERKVAFMVDAVSVRTLPWRSLGGSNPEQWIAALEKLDALDFEILAPGHGPTGKKEHVREYITYFRDLTRAVKERVDRGETLARIQETLELPKYRDWVRYGEHFDLNIEGIHRALTK
jgi:glyoxylase-like metal-dependent hydrolase (beta-lactamase superfamily II)